MSELNLVTIPSLVVETFYRKQLSLDIRILPLWTMNVSTILSKVVEIFQWQPPWL